PCLHAIAGFQHYEVTPHLRLVVACRNAEAIEQVAAHSRQRGVATGDLFTGQIPLPTFAGKEPNPGGITRTMRRAIDYARLKVLCSHESFGGKIGGLRRSLLVANIRVYNDRWRGQECSGTLDK